MCASVHELEELHVDCRSAVSAGGLCASGLELEEEPHVELHVGRSADSAGGECAPGHELEDELHVELHVGRSAASAGGVCASGPELQGELLVGQSAELCCGLSVGRSAESN